MVFRYIDEKIQAMLKSKIKPEPWLHVNIMTHPKDKKKAWYTIYVWDTRQVVGEGIVPNVNPSKESIMPGRGDGKYDWLRFASDNGKPLNGAKYNVEFDSSNEPMTMKITKPGVISGRTEITSVHNKGEWQVGMTINGVPVSFTIESGRFGVVDMGMQATGDADVAGQHMYIYANGRDAVGYYGKAISFKPTLIQSKKAEHFIGYRYKMPKLAREFANALLKFANEHPETFTLKFKRAIKSINA